MNGHGIELMDTVRHQLNETAALFTALDDADLNRPCPGEGGEATETVAAAASHLAQGYARLGLFLHSTGFVPAAPGAAADPAHGHGHGHQDAPPPATVAEVLDLLNRAEQPITLLGRLTEEQLNGVAAKSNRFADGQRTLREVIEEMTAHQAAHLATIKLALA